MIYFSAIEHNVWSPNIHEISKVLPAWFVMWKLNLHEIMIVSAQ